MIFDAFVGMAEHFLPEFRKPAERAAVFLFPGRAHEVLPEAMSDDVVRDLIAMFFLPFPIVAIEDTASCVILMDSKENQAGFSEPRTFIEITPTDHRFAVEFADGASEEKVRAESQDMPPGSYIVTAGKVENYEFDLNGGPEKIKVSGRVEYWFVATKNQLLVPARRVTTTEDPIAAASLRNAATAIEEVLFFNAPGHFVVQRDHLKARKPAKGRIARAQDRSVFTLLTPKQIREEYIPPPAPGTGPAKAPHERRRHFRTFRSDRYIHAQGKTIVVPACWVGPDEAIKNGHRYKVRLDI